MKLKPYMSILLFVIFNTVFAQSFLFIEEIGSFTDAKSFSINPTGFIFVSDISTNEIIKLDTLGKVIKSIGGFGWKESSFDYPADVFANALNVYVADKNNNRIQFFDKDLNFLSEFSTQEKDDDRIKFQYPLGVSVSTQGDLLIFDADNKRILKFNLRGEFQAAVGSYDAGMYALVNPKQFIVTSDSKIIVVDSQKLVIYDQFGNAVTKIQLQFSPENINTTFQTVCINDAKQIVLFRNNEIETRLTDQAVFNPNIEDDINDACVFGSKLFVLTKKNILVYKILQSE